MCNFELYTGTDVKINRFIKLRFMFLGPNWTDDVILKITTESKKMVAASRLINVREVGYSLFLPFIKLTYI